MAQPEPSEITRLHVQTVRDKLPRLVNRGLVRRGTWLGGTWGRWAISESGAGEINQRAWLRLGA